MVLSLLPSSDPVLHGSTHLPNRLLHQRGGRSAVQAAQQHGGGLVIRALRPLHLLHHSGTAVCRESLPPRLRTAPRRPLDSNWRLWKVWWDFQKKNKNCTENQKQQTLSQSLKTGKTLPPAYAPKGTASTMENLTTKRQKQNKNMNNEAIKWDMGTVECDGGQPRPLQHPTAADFRSDRLLCCCSAGGVLNVPLTWQPLPQRWHTFLEDYCSRSSTSFPVALSAHLLRHDCDSRYLWLLFAIFSFHFFVQFLLIFPPLPLCSSRYRGSPNRTLEWRLGSRAGCICVCLNISQPQVCRWGEQLHIRLFCFCFFAFFLAHSCGWELDAGVLPLYVLQFERRSR